MFSWTKTAIPMAGLGTLFGATGAALGPCALRAVMADEPAHVRHRDIPIPTISATGAGAAPALAADGLGRPARRMTRRLA
jgi:hypothetical protein